MRAAGQVPGQPVAPGLVNLKHWRPDPNQPPLDPVPAPLRPYVGVTESFRRSFLIAYIMRIGERLDEAGTRAHDLAEDARLLPVLARRSCAVEETFAVMFSHTVQRSVSVTNGAGWHASRVAAGRADLTVEHDAINA